MRSFDQLDWVHSFDKYEMVMYVRFEGSTDDGIYMQVLEQRVADGAQEWAIVYDRCLTSVIGDIPVALEDPAFEDEVLRRYLHEHPNVVDEEKAYLRKWLENAAEEGESQ
jgi:hypothetical protein